MLKILLNGMSTQAVVIVFRLISSVILARLLGQEGRGELAIIMTGLQFIQPLNLLLNGGNDINLKKNNKEGQLVIQALIWPAILSLIVFITFYFNQNITDFIFTSKSENSLIFLFLLFLFFSSVESNMRLLALAKQHFFYINRVQTITIILYVIVLFILTSIYSLGVLGAMIAFVLHQILMSLSYLFIVIINLDDEPITLDNSVFIGSIKLGLRSIFISLPTLLLLNVDIWVLKFLKTNYDVGIYQVGVGLCSLILAFVGLIKRLFRARSLVDNSIEEKVINTSKMIFISSLIFSTGIYYFGEYFFLILYGAEFIDSYYPARILCFGILFYSITSPMSGYIMSKGDLPISLILNAVIALTLNLVLNFKLIPIMNLEGAAIASLISYFYIMVSIFIIWYKMTSVNPIKIFNFDYSFILDKVGKKN